MCETDKTRVAYLGPKGTYSHQITNDRFGDSAILLEKSTIAEAYGALSSSIPFAVVPKENSIHGPVIETYDLLRDEKIGEQIFIREELTMAIKHSLIVRKGTKLKEIRRVLSHEQALGQCTNFLSQNVPNAERRPVNSTAAAAKAVFDNEADAAICSTVCTKLYDGLVVLHEGIQNVDRNFTKFWIFAISNSDSIPGCRLGECKGTRGALLRVQASSSQSNLTSLFGRIRLSIVHIDRRPSLSGDPFQDIYFIELQRTSNENGQWEELVALESRQICAGQWRCQVLGIW